VIIVILKKVFKSQEGAKAKEELSQREKIGKHKNKSQGSCKTFPK